VKQAILLYVNHTRIRSSNKPVLSTEGTRLRVHVWGYTFLPQWNNRSLWQASTDFEPREAAWFHVESASDL